MIDWIIILQAGVATGTVLLFAAIGEILTRYLSSASLAMTQNKMIPCNIRGTPEGWISRPAKIRPPNKMDTRMTAKGFSLASQAMMMPVKP